MHTYVFLRSNPDFTCSRVVCFNVNLLLQLVKSCCFHFCWIDGRVSTREFRRRFPVFENVRNGNNKQTQSETWVSRKAGPTPMLEALPPLLFFAVLFTLPCAPQKFPAIACLANATAIFLLVPLLELLIDT